MISEAAMKAANDIVSNLYGRAGFDDMWDSLEKDIREEILIDLAVIVQAALDKKEK